VGYFPGGRTSPATAAPRGLPQEQVVSDIPVQIAKMDSTIARAERQYGSAIAVLDHPILGPLSVKQWRKFHLVHGRHHLRQIRELQQICNVKSR
jgi:hypothetical protein